MYVSVQTVCGCHGYLLFESIHCDRCRSLIPFQSTDESLIGPPVANGVIHGMDIRAVQGSKHASNLLVSYRKPHHKHESATTGRIRFRALCPFCNSPTYVLRYHCKRERLNYHLRIQNFGESEQTMYRSIADTQNMSSYDKYSTPRSEKADNSTIQTTDDSYSLSGSISHQQPARILYDQSRIPNARDIQIENERKMYQLNDLEGDLFNVLRNGLFHDTVIQCQDDVKVQVHRCILGGRSSWFRHLLSEYHDANTQDDYVLQISIDDVRSEVLNEILNFMYTNRCLISLTNAPDLLIAAKRFELDRLTKQIAEFLLSRLTIDNAIEMLISAHESGSEALKLACIRMINRNAEKIKRTEKWRTFKTQYVDLVPELYESRVERPEPAQTAYLPDVFSAPAVPSHSLLTLSKLYENPVKERLPSPTPRRLPPSSTYRESQHVPSNESIEERTSGYFVQRTDSISPPIGSQKTSVKKNAASITRYRAAPPPPAPPLARNIFPTVKQSSEVETYRRPVNVYGRSAALPTTDREQHSAHDQIPQRRSHQTSMKVSRAVSPKRVIEIRRSLSSSELQPEQHLTLGRVVSVDTMD